jgi:cadmium resistance protein CadD (predicted permease)
MILLSNYDTNYVLIVLIFFFKSRSSGFQHFSALFGQYWSKMFLLINQLTD